MRKATRTTRTRVEKVARAIVSDVVVVYTNDEDVVITTRHILKLLRQERARVRRIVKDLERQYTCLMQAEVLDGSLESVATARDKAEACRALLAALRGGR